MKIIVINKGRLEIKEYLWVKGRIGTKKQERELLKLQKKKELIDAKSAGVRLVSHPHTETKETTTEAGKN